MARSRSNPDSATPNKGEKMSNVLTPDAIAALLAKGRTRGEYDRELRSFLDGGEAGIEVDLSSGPLAGKTSKQAKTGLDNARKRVNEKGELAVEGGNNVRVIEADGKVFLINTSVAVAEAA